jgi:hypothetical protein
VGTQLAAHGVVQGRRRGLSMKRRYIGSRMDDHSSTLLDRVFPVCSPTFQIATVPFLPSFLSLFHPRFNCGSFDSITSCSAPPRICVNINSLSSLHGPLRECLVEGRNGTQREEERFALTLVRRRLDSSASTEAACEVRTVSILISGAGLGHCNRREVTGGAGTQLASPRHLEQPRQPTAI